MTICAEGARRITWFTESAQQLWPATRCRRRPSARSFAPPCLLIAAAAVSLRPRAEIRLEQGSAAQVTRLAPEPDTAVLTGLIRRCGEMLDEAEQKVVKLKKGPDRQPVELPFEDENA